MKLSRSTLDVLKNAAAINQGILIRPGSVIRSMSTRKNIYLQAEVSDVFPKECAIYDLNEYLSTLNLFNDPDLEFGESSIVIKSDTNTAVYHYSQPSVVVFPPDKNIQPPPHDVSFELSATDLDKLQKAASCMKLGLIHVDNAGLHLYGSNSESSRVTLPDNSGNVFTVEVDIDGEPKKPIIMSVNSFKIIPGSYSVKVASEHGIFSLDAINPTITSLKYFIALESVASK